MYVFPYRYSVGYDGKVSAVMLKKGTRIFVDPVNVNTKSASYFVGKQCREHFHQPTVKQQEIFWKELGFDKVERYWAVFVGFCFFEVAQ